MLAAEKSTVSKPLQEWFESFLEYFLRPVQIIRTYRTEYLRTDLMAGLTVAVVLLPQGIAYALIAELPPQMGLYAAIVAAIVGALWGSSIHLHSGPTNAGSLLAFATLVTVAAPETPEYVAAAGLLAVMVGAARILLGAARLGVLVNFVSNSVIIGFTFGAAILIAVNQVRPLLALDVASNPAFYRMVAAIVRHLSETHWLSLGVGLGTVAAILLIRRLRPKWPSILLGMALAAAVVGVLRLDRQGVVVLGELPRSLPPLASLPLFDLDLIGELSTGALAISLIGLVEAISITRAIAAKTGQRLDSNQEFVGQGMANLVAGFFSGFVCSGSFTRSALNYEAGARTAMAAVFSGIWALLAMLLLAPLAAYLPRAALAGVIILAAYSMIDRKEMKRIWQASRGDSAIMIATILATLLLPLQFAVLAGIITSIIRFLVKTSTPHVRPVVPDENFKHFVRQKNKPACPQLGIITVSGPLYFGATQHVEHIIRDNQEQHPEQRYLLLRMHLVDHCDVSGIHMLESIVRLYRQRRGDVFISGLHEPVMNQMESSGFVEMLGRDHFFDRESSIPYIFHKVLEPSICVYECEHRVFAECQALPKWLAGSEAPEAVSLPEPDIESWLPSELKGHLDRNGAEPDFLLIDVREPQEYEKGHIPQAELLPLRLISEQGQSLAADKKIVLVCRIGRRSRMAAVILKGLGYNKVYNLEGGVLAWEAAGYPLAVE